MNQADPVQLFRGVAGDTASLREQRKALSKSLAAADREQVLQTAHRLIEGGVARFVAYELVLHHKTTLAGLTRTELERLGYGMTGWGEIDAFGCFVSGPAWREGRIKDDVVRGWARSEDWRWRRAALVSTVALNCKARGGSGDTRRTVEICTMLAGDRHLLVVKALSWALRELAKRDPAVIREFLVDQRENLNARVIREVTNKLRTGLKNPRNRLPNIR